MAGVFTAELRRTENTQPWGFRMRGGAQQGMPLFIEQVNPNGRAASAGLAPGDAIVAICGANVQRASHDQAKGEILRAGNELDITVQRGGAIGKVPPPQTNAPAQRAPQPQPQYQPQPQAPRAEVVEEPIASLGGPVYKDVKPKTYQVLAEELPSSSQGVVYEPVCQSPGGRPASIFDRKKQDRSAYLQASGKTIQRAYGQQH